MINLELELEEVPSIDLEFSDIKIIDAIYNGGETDSIEVTTDNDKRIIYATLKQVQYDSKDQFPEVGSDRLIYVDLSNNSLWVYDNGEYVSVGSNLKIDSSDWIGGGSDVKTIKFGLDFSVSLPDENKKSNVKLSDGFKNDLQSRLDAKLDKISTTSTNPQLYAKNADGSQTMLNAVQYYSDDRNGIARYINGNLIVNTPSENGHASTKKYVDDKFNGASKPITYDTYPQMIEVLNGMSATDINRGQDIMVVQTGVPDIWVAYIEETSVPYTYVDDETFVNELLTNGTVQVGYFKLGYLETQKIDLTEYAKIEQLNEKQDKLTAGKNIIIDENNTISSGGLNISDLPKFTNKLHVNMANATSLAGIITLPIASSSNFIVDWGDGTITDYVDATTEISHTYTDTSFEGWIYIYGDWKGVQFTSTSNNNKPTIIEVIYDNNVTDIAESAFRDCTKLLNIKLPESLVSLGISSFYGCTYLRSIVIPDGVSSIENYTFRNCRNLLKAVIGEKVTTIGDYAFGYCDKLEKITIGSSVTTIGIGAFYGTAIHDIEIPYGVIRIEDSAFQACSSLENVKIPRSVNGIGNYAFANCTVLKRIKFMNTGGTLGTSALPTQNFFNTISYEVPSFFLSNFKKGTNWSLYADYIYPHEGNYSETITIPSTAWDTATNTVTVEAVGATSEDRNIITWNVSSDGVQVENTYGLKCTAQGTMSLTFSCETIPTGDVEVSVRYMLTNY